MLGRRLQCKQAGLWLALLLSVCTLSARADAPGQYLSLEDFLAQSFPEHPPEAKVAWLDAELKTRLKTLTGKPFPLLRVRYWQQGPRTAWVLEEIGKEQPITIGVVVEDQHIANVAVLVFRESRGWEIRHDFFTRQFQGVALNARHKLDARIDGITGATLSVGAMKHVAQVALVLAENLASEN